jgi:hypothetical protein
MGRRFESCRAHHITLCFVKLPPFLSSHSEREFGNSVEFLPLTALRAPLCPHSILFHGICPPAPFVPRMVLALCGAQAIAWISKPGQRACDIPVISLFAALGDGVK